MSFNQLNLRVWCNGNTSGFQSEDLGSIPKTRTTSEELKEIINREVSEFRNATNRDTKRNIMVERRNDTLSFKLTFLHSVYPEIIKNLGKVSELDFENFEPEIVFCDDDRLKEVWNFFRYICSSLTNTGYYGRNIKYLLVDKHTKCILGIVGLGSDFMALGLRDNYIGWNRENKYGKTLDKDGNIYTEPTKTWKNMKTLGLTKQNNRINNLMNIFVCVPVYPFNELIMGKLLAMSCFSKEVMDKFESIYHQKLVGITTTSIYGKSIQYDRISDYLKFLGLSKGIGTVQFSKTTINKIKDYYVENQVKNGWEDVSNLGLQPKAKMISVVCKDLGFNSKILEHSHQRGIYFGYTYKNSKSFLNGTINEDKLEYFEDRTIKEIVNFWKERWLVKRIKNFDNIKNMEKEIIDYYNLNKFK